MKIETEAENAVDRFAREQGITRKEALDEIARDWLIGQGYLSCDHRDEEKHLAEK